MAKTGFIGLGVMGEPMAGHIASSGVPAAVWNRTAGKAERLRGLGAEVKGSIGELAAECSVICVCVNRSEDVREVCEQIAAAAKPGTLVIDHSTIDPTAAVEINTMLSSKGIRFVDAPITGGSAGAQSGQLTIFMGGSEEDVKEAIETAKPYSKRAERVGGPGKGQWMKLSNQIAVAGALAGLCECLAFAEKAGLDPAQARDMVGSGAAGSWAFNNYGPKILDRDWSPGFSIINQRKDFGYCASAANKVGASIPVTALVDSMLEELQEDGRGEQATTALFDLYVQE